MWLVPTTSVAVVSPVRLLRTCVSSCAAFLLVLQPSLKASADVGWDGSSRLSSCPAESNCVSSNYAEPPNRYISPLQTSKDRETAFAKALRDLSIGSATKKNPVKSQVTVSEALPKAYYIHLTVPGTAPGSLDDIELVFGDEGIVNWRCQARVTLPPPPFCIQKNCINGNMDQRRRMDRVGQILGMPKADQERMDQSAKWTPIFFNSDRVPGFEDDLDTG